MRASRREVRQNNEWAESVTQEFIKRGGVMTAGEDAAIILRAEVIALRRDKERLGYVQENLSDIGWDHLAGKWLCEGTAGKTLRRAIDSAMTAAKKAGRKG